MWRDLSWKEGEEWDVLKRGAFIRSKRGGGGGGGMKADVNLRVEDFPRVFYLIIFVGT